MEIFGTEIPKLLISVLVTLLFLLGVMVFHFKLYETQVKPRYIYHYCAQWQENNHSLTYQDGIAIMENRIDSLKDVQELKKHAHEPWEEVTILSLSFIGMEE